MYISKFEFEGQEVRTVVINGEVWFVAKDVFDRLNIYWNGSRALNPIPDLWKAVANLATPSGNQDTHVINLKAVYKIAFRSNKSEADAFTNRAAEIVENVGKNGMHIETSTSPLALAKVMLEAMEQQEHRINALENSQFQLKKEVKSEVEQVREEIGEKPISQDSKKEARILHLIQDLAIKNGGERTHYSQSHRRFKKVFSLAKYSQLPMKYYAEAEALLLRWHKELDEEIGYEEDQFINKGLWSEGDMKQA